MRTVRQQWDEVTLSKVFEVPVIDKRTNEDDYITFDINVEGSTFKAQHIALNQDQEESTKIAFISIDIDEDFDLTHHLEDLYDACVTAIFESEFYEHTDLG